VSGRPVTPVAVGVLLRADGAVLLADRPPGKPYAGYWEFPGGKIEPGESVEQALARELDEELHIRIGPSHPWVVTEFDYPHAYVRLHFRLIREWSGEPHAAEGQNLRFIDAHRAPDLRYLPAAVPALRWLTLPSVLLFGPPKGSDATKSLAWLDDVLGRGVRAIVWTGCATETASQEATWLRASDLAASYGVTLLRDVAGIRDVQDAAMAARRGCEFAVLEEGAAVGVAGQCALPVYVRGELKLETLREAQCAGAHGLAIETIP
jgi:8-oxo-dGTP diphosphatase